ncbi:MAG: hypothetical protein KJO07_14475, partial [Deltaproteobacteria bacterium]|nr:hypothetical protein [Deltaproteobacteria bacterium]
VYGPLARMIAALAPCIAVAIWTHVSLGSIALLSFSPVHSGAMVAALFLLPLLLLGAAIAGSAFAVLNPLTWFKALRLLGVRYLIVSTLFYVLVAALLAWTVWATPALLAIPLLGRLLGLLGGYLIMAAAAKLLGIALEPHV